MTYEPEKCCQIIVACMVLHNMCIDGNVPLDDENDDDDEDNANDNDEVFGDFVAENENHDAGEEQQIRNGWRVREQLVEQRFQ